jgi:NAD(P)-dependent dehydrogenase (short-subunit alcohol dehydrogenase family)
MIDKLLDEAMDWTVLPGYSKVGYALRERLVPRGALELAGRSAIVTGATSGIGEAACVALARGGASVHLVVRDLERGEEARKRVAEASGSEALKVHRCDLSDLASVRAFARAFATTEDGLDVLVNNAGVLPPERTHTDEGFELTFATNVLGPFLLTALLVPSLAASAPSRVINVSSGGMYTAKLDLDDLQLAGHDYSGNRFYAHTKRAEVVLGDEWARRLAPEGVHVYSMHPGWVATPGVAASLPGFNKVMGPLLRDPAAGADTIVWLAGSPAAGAETGGFWHDRRRRPEHRLPSTREADGDAARLFEECERLSGATVA